MSRDYQNYACLSKDFLFLSQASGKVETGFGFYSKPLILL
jgi:hypothetical protein